MDSPSRHQSVLFLIMRRLRAPLILLIGIFSLAVLGLTLIPGPEIDGRIEYLSFFHAFYFISYTATTIGFGEVPYSFSEQQRLWVTLSIYLSVFGWAYTLGTVFALLSDRALQQAIAHARFVRQVRRLGEAFYLVCGYGETGRQVCQALERMRHRVVVLDIDEIKVGEIALHSFASDVPALCADAGNPEILRSAGLTHARCAGVIALTSDDAANLSIAITARLLAPGLSTLCRAEHAGTLDNMLAFGTHHVINPFERFSEAMALALHAPAAWKLLNRLTGLDGARRDDARSPPRGQWIVCGHGDFGRRMASAMRGADVPVRVIDRRPPPAHGGQWVEGSAAEASVLRAAGALRASAVVAATASDVDNLAIALAARTLNPALFIVLRQNHSANRPLFDAFGADIVVVPSQIVAHECLAILGAPLLAPFLRAVRAHDDAWNQALLARVDALAGRHAPEIWSERINLARAPALYRRLMQGERITLEMLLRSPADRSRALPCIAAYLQRDDDDHLLLPAAATAIRAGDELLLLGTRRSRGDFALVLANEHALAYVLSGRELHGGWLWSRLSGAAARERAARARKPHLP